MTRLAVAVLALALLPLGAAAGLIETVAGGGAGDGLAAVEQGFEPVAVATDLAGDPLIADATHDRIRRVDLATGLIGTVAGRGWIVGYSGYDIVTDCGWTWGDGGPATGACLVPVAVARDAAGNVFVADVHRLGGDGVIRVGGGRLEEGGHTVSTIGPVVRRPSRSACARAASLSAYRCRMSMRTTPDPIASNTALALATSSSRAAM